MLCVLSAQDSSAQLARGQPHGYGDGEEDDVGTEDTEGGAVEGNEDATRALLRVKQKLDGYEEGELRSVEGQVQQLIHDAQDPERLCAMFPGWAPWL